MYLSKKDITYGYYCDILKNFHNYLKEISNKKKIELQELNNDANNIITRLVSILKELDKNYYQGCVTQLKDILSKKDHKPEDFTKIKKFALHYQQKYFEDDIQKDMYMKKLWRFIMMKLILMIL